MPEFRAATLSEFTVGSKKTCSSGDVKVLVIRLADGAHARPHLVAVEAECPHAKAPLEKGAVCNARLICPWHAGTFDLTSGALLEPPPLRPLLHYPLRVDDSGEIFVDTAPIPAAQPKPVLADKHFVFVGAGAAAAAGACFLREHGFAGNLTLVDPVGNEPIDRTALSKTALAGQKPVTKLPLLDAAMQEHMRSQANTAVAFNHIRASVSELQPLDHRVRLDNGNLLSYDAAFLATGAVAKLPGMPGDTNDNVITLRHASDLGRLESYLGGEEADAAAHVVILGDSFIAFEAAASLRKRKPPVAVTVVARAGLPLAQKFGDEIATALMDLHRSHGVTLITEDEGASLDGERLTLKSGRTLQVSAVLIAIGVTPATELAQNDDPYRSHVSLNKHLSFSVGSDLSLGHDIYAGGDATTVDGQHIEHWRVAQQHGRVAAAAMMGLSGEATPSQYTGVPFFWTAYYGKSLRYVGHADEWDTVAIDGSPAELNFVAYFVREGEVAAVLGCGHDTATAALTQAMATPLTLDEAREVVARYEA